MVSEQDFGINAQAKIVMIRLCEVKVKRLSSSNTQVCMQRKHPADLLQHVAESTPNMYVR